jgi:hypothetical protein
MLTKIIALMALLMLSTLSLASGTTDITENYALPQEMKGCKIFYVQSKSDWDSWQSLYITHCPSAKNETAFSVGKTQQRVLSTSSIVDEPEVKQETIEINGSKYIKVND